MRSAIASLLTVIAVTASAQQTESQPQLPKVDYRFESVKRKVTLQGKEVGNGQLAHGGDKVTTGWFSYALIASDGHRAKFEIFSSSDVTLSDGTPGVILSLERGRIRAAFDKITGSEPRIVKTPGALLAVRGTEFDVTVDASGNARVDVFEGLVEIRSPLHPQPMFVRPGEESSFGPRRSPETRPMPEHRRREGENRRREPEGGDRARPDDGSRQPRDGQPPRGGHGPGSGPGAGPGGGGPRPPQPPTPRPRP